MTEARRLLRYSEMSISEVAYELGYNDVQTFSRFFKKREGTSPLDYRKMGKLMGKAKQLKREGVFDGLSFTEVVLEEEEQISPMPIAAVSGCGIEFVWKDNIIRFGSSELLVDFLKKAA